MRRTHVFAHVQGNVDKVIVVIKDNEDVALERFIFAVQNMIQVESYNKETGYARHFSVVGRRDSSPQG